MIAVVTFVELGWLALFPPGPADDTAEAMSAGYWWLAFFVPIVLGAATAGIAVIALWLIPFWGRVVGVIWASVGGLYATMIFLGSLGASPSENVELGVRTAPFTFGLALLGSASVIILLWLAPTASGGSSPTGAAGEKTPEPGAPRLPPGHH